MQIDLTIYTYGHYQAMFYILNGIALIMNSPFADGLIKLMMTATMAYYGFCMAYVGAEGRSKEYLIKILAMSVVVGSLIIPRGEIDVEDRITGQRDTISNLPVAFIVPIGILEAFGGAITSGFEQAFTPVGSMQYKDYGMIFGARLVNETRNWRIANPEFASNMDMFLKRCVVVESMIGAHFTVQDLIDSDDILGLVTNSSGNFRKVDFKQGKAAHRLTCKEAANKLQNYLTSELDFLNKRYSFSDFGQAGSKNVGLSGRGYNSPNLLLNSQLKINIELAYSGILGTDLSAEQIIRQTMMINAIHDYNDKADLYGYSRAANIQEKNWMLGGALASEYLPILLSVLKGLVYASFIFVVPLMIISGGIHRYINYLIVVISLQLWPALNAVLNLFIELYTQSVGRNITGGILTYATFNQSHQAIDKIVTVASGLQWILPLLSMSIARGGAHAFINLAGSIGNISQSAASVAASEVTSGSRNFDNMSFNNMQRAQQSAYKTDYNSSYVSGASSYQHMDGVMEKVTASGQTILTSGAGQTASTGTVRFTVDQGKISQMQEGLNYSQNLVESDQIAYNNARSSTLSKASHLVSNLAQREVMGHSHNYETIGEQGQTLQQAVNYAKELQEQNNYGWDQAASMSVKAYLDVGGKIANIPILNSGAGIVGDGSMTASNVSNQSLSHNDRVLSAHDVSKNFSNLVRVASNENWMREQNIDLSYGRDIRGSYEEMQSISKNLTMHKEQAEGYNKALSFLDNLSGTSSTDMYHLVEKQLMQKYQVSQQDAHKMIEGQDARALYTWNNMINDRVINYIGQGGHNVERKSEDNLREYESNHKRNIDTAPMEYVDRTAMMSNLNKNEITNQINKQYNEIEEKAELIKGDNKERYSGTQEYNKALKQEFMEKAGQYEQDRIGRLLKIGAPTKSDHLPQKNDDKNKKQ